MRGTCGRQLPGSDAEPPHGYSHSSQGSAHRLRELSASSLGLWWLEAELPKSSHCRSQSPGPHLHTRRVPSVPGL